MTVTWKIATIEKAPTEGNLSDVCKVIHWRADEIETVDGVDYSGGSYGSVSLEAPDASSFTAYASITESDAISWAKAALGADEVTRVEASIASQITEAKTPSITTGVPWS
jgi:hypothetical protein